MAHSPGCNSTTWTWLFRHRPDPTTPIEETVWAFHDMIGRGESSYWGTSEWSAVEIMEAWHIADKHHLRKPVMEQPQYNMLTGQGSRKAQFARLYEGNCRGNHHREPFCPWGRKPTGKDNGNGGLPAGSLSQSKKVSKVAINLPY